MPKSESGKYLEGMKRTWVERESFGETDGCFQEADCYYV